VPFYLRPTRLPGNPSDDFEVFDSNRRVAVACQPGLDDAFIAVVEPTAKPVRQTSPAGQPKVLREPLGVLPRIGERRRGRLQLVGEHLPLWVHEQNRSIISATAAGKPADIPDIAARQQLALEGLCPLITLSEHCQTEWARPELKLQRRVERCWVK
jgi:hypothetical protein